MTQVAARPSPRLSSAIRTGLRSGPSCSLPPKASTPASSCTVARRVSRAPGMGGRAGEGTGLYQEAHSHPRSSRAGIQEEASLRESCWAEPRRGGPGEL